MDLDPAIPSPAVGCTPCECGSFIACLTEGAPSFFLDNILGQIFLLPFYLLFKLAISLEWLTLTLICLLICKKLIFNRFLKDKFKRNTENIITASTCGTIFLIYFLIQVASKPKLLWGFVFFIIVSGLIYLVLSVWGLIKKTISLKEFFFTFALIILPVVIIYFALSQMPTFIF